MSSDDDDRSGSSSGPRRRDTLILAVVGLGAAVLLFASAALPVLSDRAPDDGSGETVLPTSTVRSPSATSSVPQLQSSPPPSTVKPAQTTADVATAPPSTIAPSSTPPATVSTSTAPTTTPATTTTSTAPPQDVAEPTAVVTRPRTDRGGAPARPLAVGPLDASAFPRVSFDVVVPERLAAVQLRSTMVAVDGLPVDAVTVADPRDIAAALIIDDSPKVAARVLGRLQGASVELVRNLGRGSEIALATPSGLASAFTPSRDANIGRIAAITAGSPAVTPLPGLLTNALRELASKPRPDRHAILMLGQALAPTAGQLRALERAVTRSGARLHLIVPKRVDATAIASVAQASGGVVASSASIVASIDAVTAAIARRYRVVATMPSRGVHVVTLTARGLRYEAVVRL